MIWTGDIRLEEAQVEWGLISLYLIATIQMLPSSITCLFPQRENKREDILRCDLNHQEQSLNQAPLHMAY